MLAIGGLQPDVGHEVLWVLRDCLSGEILLAKSLLSARQQDLAELLAGVRDALSVPIAAVVSDGQHSIRKAVAKALPAVAHQLCHFHHLREAARLAMRLGWVCRAINGALPQDPEHTHVRLKMFLDGRP